MVFITVVCSILSFWGIKWSFFESNLGFMFQILSTEVQPSLSKNLTWGLAWKQNRRMPVRFWLRYAC